MSRRNRRQFLEESMLAAAAAAAASSPARMLFSQDEPQSKSPNERLNVAVVGTKGRGGSHIGAFAGRKDTVITYAVDVDANIGNNRVNFSLPEPLSRAWSLVAKADRVGGVAPAPGCRDERRNQPASLS